MRPCPARRRRFLDGRLAGKRAFAPRLVGAPAGRAGSGRVVEHAEAAALVVQQDLSRAIEPVPADLTGPETRRIWFGARRCPARWKGYEDLVASVADREPEVEVSLADPWTHLCASGTTGRPKGVPKSHRAAVLLSLVTEIELALRQRAARPALPHRSSHDRPERPHARSEPAAPVPDLVADPLVWFDRIAPFLGARGSSTQRIVDQAFRRMGLAPEPQLVADTRDAVYEAVAVGIGIGFIWQHGTGRSDLVRRVSVPELSRVVQEVVFAPADERNELVDLLFAVAEDFVGGSTAKPTPER